MAECNCRHLKMFETTLRDGRVVRISAPNAYDARLKLQELYGVREVLYVPKMIPS